MFSYFDIRIKSFSRRISWFLASKIDSEPWKFPSFEGSHISCVTRYHKILGGCSFGCKNILNFTWNTMKFHNRCYATADLSLFSTHAHTVLHSRLETLFGFRKKYVTEKLIPSTAVIRNSFAMDRQVTG